jgi:hypothetical protein
MLHHLQKHPDMGVFEPEAVKVMTTALDEAWKTVAGSGAPLSSDRVQAAREVLALRIIEMAALGERDANRRRDDALLFLARTNAK